MIQEPMKFDDLSPELKKVTEQMAIALSGSILAQAKELAETISKVATDQADASSDISIFLANEGLAETLKVLNPSPSLPTTGRKEKPR